MLDLINQSSQKTHRTWYYYLGFIGLSWPLVSLFYHFNRVYLSQYLYD